MPAEGVASRFQKRDHAGAMTFWNVTGLLWLALVVYWLIASRNNKTDVYREAGWRRFMSSFGILLGAALLNWRRLSFGWLGLSLLPSGFATGLGGTLVCAAGLLLALWARRVLGANWSGVVALKENHELILRGPYRLVRHPIYSGVLLMVLGTAIVIGELRGVVALVVFLGCFALRIHDEEAILTRQFPQEYPRYQQRTRRLIPWLF